MGLLVPSRQTHLIIKTSFPFVQCANASFSLRKRMKMVFLLNCLDSLDVSKIESIKCSEQSEGNCLTKIFYCVLNKFLDFCSVL